MKRSWLAVLAEGRQHLEGAGEGYGRHFRFAFGVGLLMVLAGLSAMLHAIVPGLLRDRASRTLDALQVGLKQRSTAEAEAVLGEDKGGLITLIALSLMVAIFPWAASIDLPIAATLSLLALGFPVAALRATDGDVDEPFGEAADHVVIIGGGFSGTMLAVQLARTREMRVTLVDRGANPGQGVAYSTCHPAHLLNVRAGKMSAFPDDPGHFARWLAARGLGGADDFASRRSYGDYLKGLLRATMVESGGRLAVLRGEAVDVEPGAAGVGVRFADGRSLTADRVVLASGNLPPRGLPALDAADLPPALYRGDPWSPGLAHGLGAEDIVLLVGTGLTMVDVAVALADAGFAGRILAVSRRGLLPRVHEAAAAVRLVPPAAGQPVSAMLRAVRRSAAEHGWRPAIDALRPHTARLWQGATAQQRARFLRHLRPWWDVHRHRLAPASADRIATLRAEGRLELVAGRIVAAEADAEGVRVVIRPRGISYLRTVRPARIVNCTGADGDLIGTGDALLAGLIARRLVRPDAHRLGIDVAPDGATIDVDGMPSRALFAIGPLTRGREWEATAVPELRLQAAELAVRLAETEGLTRFG